jgi:hypothetical protein
LITLIDKMKISINHATLFITILTLATSSFAGMMDPFPPGFSMGTQGAVINGSGATGRDPLTSASACNDTSGFGLSLCGISYYGSMGGIAGSDAITQAFGGGWYAMKHFVGKAAIAELNALDVYYEQTGSISLGTDYVPFMRISVEATGYRNGVRTPGSSAHTVAETGLSAWVPWSWAAFSFQIEHIVIDRSDIDGGDPQRALQCGIHTVGNRFGGQGAIITITPGVPSPVCFTIGEEYRIADRVAFNAAFSNNPVFISCGISLQLSRSDFSVALVNHARLGWSQGFAAGYRGGGKR